MHFLNFVSKMIVCIIPLLLAVTTVDSAFKSVNLDDYDDPYTKPSQINVAKDLPDNIPTIPSTSTQSQPSPDYPPSAEKPLPGAPVNMQPECPIVDKFYKRFVHFLAKQIPSQVHDQLCCIKFNLTKEVRAAIESYAAGKDHHVERISSLFHNSIDSITPVTDCQETGEIFSHGWFEDMASFLDNPITGSIFKMVIIVYMSIWTVSQTWEMFRKLGLFWFLAFVVSVCFIASIPWSWMHLYQKELASRLKRSAKTGFGPPIDCTPEKLSFHAYFRTDYESKCQEYYEDALVNPIWTVSPVEVLSTSFVKFCQPFQQLGSILGGFVYSALDPFPCYMKILLVPLGSIIFTIWLIILSGLRISTWFFSIETGMRPQPSNNQVLPTAPPPAVAAPPPASSVPTPAVTAPASLPAINAAGDGPAETADPISSFDHIVLVTADVDRIIGFYMRLGFHLVTFKENRKALKFGNCKINIHEVGNPQKISPTAAHPEPGSLDFCVVCKSDLDITSRRLQGAGIEIEMGPVNRTGAIGPIVSLYVRDPDQNLIELAHYARRLDLQVDTVPY